MIRLPSIAILTLALSVPAAAQNAMGITFVVDEVVDSRMTQVDVTGPSG